MSYKLVISPVSLGMLRFISPPPLPPHISPTPLLSTLPLPPHSHLQIKIADFGYARFFKTEGMKAVPLDSGVGTVVYMVRIQRISLMFEFSVLRFAYDCPYHTSAVISLKLNLLVWAVLHKTQFRTQHGKFERKWNLLYHCSRILNRHNRRGPLVHIAWTCADCLKKIRFRTLPYAFSFRILPWFLDGS